MIHVAGQAACHTAYETTREASYILSDYKDFKIVAVDCGKGPKWGKVCYNYSFHSYPDFRFFKNGEQVFHPQSRINYSLTPNNKKPFSGIR